MNVESSIQSVIVSFPNGGTIAELRVLTGGIANADFTLNTAGTCVAGASFPGAATCSLAVTFQPKAPGERRGAVVVLDAGGNVLGSQQLYGVGTGPLGVFNPAEITTVAGNGQWLYTDDGHPATQEPIFLPGGAAVDPAGNLYIADSGNNRIRRVDGSSHIISTVAGTGSPGSINDGGAATLAGVSNPSALLLDGAGDLYIADTANHAVRKLSLATGTLSTVAGRLNRQGYSGDGGAATAASLNTPEGLAFDPAGNLYISDSKNHVIRRVDAVTGVITTYAGQGGRPGFSGDGGQATAATLNTPWGLATDMSGNLYVADLNNNRIREVAVDGTISTVVGDGSDTIGADGQGVTGISNPAAVAVNVAGDLFFADSGHNLVRRLSATTHLLSTVAGSALSTFTGDEGPATKAGLYGPYALTFDSLGNLFIADIFHHRIREVVASHAVLSYQPIRVGRTSAPQQQAIENEGNGALNWLSFDPDPNSAVSTSSTTCATATPLAVGVSCSIGAEFFPQVTGAKVTAAIQLRSDAANSAGTITLSGEVDELDPTRTSITSNANPAALGSGIILTARVAGDAQQPSGDVRFYDGATLLGTATTDSGGTANLTISTLALGSHTITANFTGDAQDSPSTSAALTEVVKRQPAVGLTSSLNPSKVGNGVTFSAAVVTDGAQPTGDIVFSDGGTPIGTVPLNTSGVATFSTASLSAGQHTISAAYSGDANTLSGTSSTLTQTVNKWATSLTISSSAAADVGSPVTFTISATPSSAVIPSGSVILRDGTATLATLLLDSSGSASLALANLNVGLHTLTASYGGDATNAPADSAAFAQTIRQIGTAVTVSSSANPSNGGATLRMTASVTPNSTNTFAGTLDGTVTFLDGTTPLGAGAVATDGTFTLNTNSLAVGTHTVKAVFSGNTNYAASTSAGFSQQVVLATTSIQLTSSANPVISGNGIVLTGVVTGNGAIPSGTVNFLDGSTSVGHATINSSGQANLSLSSLPAGSHTLTATYGGDASDSASSSAALLLTVSQAATTTTLVSSSNPAIAGTSLTLLCTLSSNGSLPAGQLVLQEGSANLGTALIGPTGTARFSLATLSPGSHTLTASFAGDADHVASISTPLIQVIQLATSQAFLTPSVNPSLLGDAATFSARITGTGLQPTGGVTLHDGSTILGTTSLDANGFANFSLSTLSLGPHTITLTYAGDATHAASTPATLVQHVQQATTTTLVSNANPAIVGAPVTLTATLVSTTGSSVAGTVNFTDGGTLLGTAVLSSAGTATFQTSSLAAGTHLIAAQYVGDETDRASVSAPVSQAINTADTAVTVSSSANPSIAGAAVTFTASVSSRGQAANGEVSFLDGSVTLGTGKVVGGIATFTTTALTAGSHAIVARYGGDTGTQISTSAVLSEVTQERTASSLAVSQNPLLTAQSVTLRATLAQGANPSGTFTFFDGGEILGTAALDANGAATLTVPALAAGSHALSAHYSGDSYNLPSGSSSVSEVVQLRPCTTSLTASSPTYLDGQQVTLVAVVHFDGPLPPGGTVTFTSAGQTLGSSTLSAAGAATLVFAPAAASYDLVAVYSGDSVYSGSTADTYTISRGSSASFDIVSDPPSFALKSGEHTTLTVSMSDTSNFSDTLSLGCLDLPADATCTFSQSEAKLAAGGTSSVQLVFDTGNPLGSGAKASVESSPGGITRASFWLPPVLLCGIFFFFARRRVRVPHLLSLVLLAAAAFGVTGCGNSLNVSKTPPGSYTVRVIATGKQTGISRILNIAVSVQ